MAVVVNSVGEDWRPRSVARKVAETGESVP